MLELSFVTVYICYDLTAIYLTLFLHIVLYTDLEHVAMDLRDIK